MKRTAALAVITLLLAGCTPATGDQAFLDAVKPHMREPIDSTGKPTGDWSVMLDIGKRICASEDSVAETKESWVSAGMLKEEAETVVAEAVNKLCPDRKDWLAG